MSKSNGQMVTKYTKDINAPKRVNPLDFNDLQAPYFATI